MTSPLDAQPVGVEAAKRVTLELMSVLGEFRDSITLVGGSAPPLMVGEQAADRYSGTLDVDVVVDPIELPEETYRTIAQLLGGRGYEQGPQPFQWSRVIDVAGQPVRVQVDLLATRTERSGRAHRHEEIGGGMLARRLEGAELLRVCYENKELRGVLPDGRRNSVVVRVARPAAFVVLKALALNGREKAKDSYDIDYVLAHVAGGPAVVGREIARLGDVDPVRTAIDALGRKFNDADALGPASVALYRELDGDSDDALRARALAFARVQRLLTAYHSTSR